MIKYLKDEVFEVKIEIWSDFICPYCYIGKTNLEIALKKANVIDDVKIEYKSFRLGPFESKDTDSFYRVLMNRNNKTLDEIKTLTNKISEQAKQIGITIHFDRMKYADTLNAHRLTKYAESFGKEKDVVNLIYKKYFTDNENIGHKQVLINIAQEIGLDTEEVDALLCLNKYAKSVKLDEELAKEIGIEGVPFFIFNEEYAITGAQSVDVFLQVIEELTKEESVNGKWNDSTGGYCKTTYCIGEECDL